MLRTKVGFGAILILSCILGAMALMQHLELRKLRKENAAYREKLEGAERLSGDRPIRLDAVMLPENSSTELLRLRGEVSVLRRAEAEAKARSASQVDSKELRRQGFQGALEVLESRFSEEQQRELLARQKLQELEATLGVPENITNLDLTACVNDPSLRQYQPLRLRRLLPKRSAIATPRATSIAAVTRTDAGTCRG
jgi:hypothetical protein